MESHSYIANADLNYIDDLYKRYQADTKSVDETWQKFFEGFDFSQQHAINGAAAVSPTETKVRNLIYAYRAFGHLKSDTNPVRERRNHKEDLSLQRFELSEKDLEEPFEVGHEVGLGKAKLKVIVDRLSKAYLGHVGFELAHIRDNGVVDWLLEYTEKKYPSLNYSSAEKLHILNKLNEAVVFENFLHTKYIGQKRFSLEGGENTIPALDRIINRAAELDAEEVVIGMAHRGRLNVLTNIMGKTYEQIFSEFEGNTDTDQAYGDGDVKYHLGYSSFIETLSGKKVYVKLAPNPSHLEAVDPVVLGYSRAQIDDEYQGDFSKVIPILIHGDAALAGQGVVYECIQMSLLKGYRTGGTIHLVINNQVGFTTDYDDARSSIYCTDLAKIVDAPIVHVNGDDPEAVVFCANMAIEYRQKFQKDFFIDLLCYRRHGHNESDEPKFTQPKLYNLIAKHPNPREVYVKQLITNDDLSEDRAKQLDKDFKKLLQDRLNEIKQKTIPYVPQKIEEEWKSLRYATSEDFEESPDTSISKELLERVATELARIPEEFRPLKQIDKLLKERKKNFFEEGSLSWADAELLAYGSILGEGKIVRMSGQDVIRGTFSHRHAKLFDSNTNEPYCNLDQVNPDQPLRIYNSLLSEYGVLGFEYGYAMATPQALIIWEAQFGDFSNGAQVMIDQFITSAESKWQRMNGLVMLLPHGYEGQGPEHSSARMERFLQMSDNNNMVVCNLTTSANLFHMFRRQLAWEFRKPCVVFSPKSLLRNEKVNSPIQAFTDGKFSEVYGDSYVTNKNVRRVLLCSGKVYYDLLDKQQEEKIKEVAIVRLEQLAPFPKKQLNNILKKYNDPELVWVQEEPVNMGAWTYMIAQSGMDMKVIARKLSASPATGFAKRHKQEQERIVNEAFTTSAK